MFHFSEICGLGQAPNLTNTDECIDCDIGYYSDVLAADQCSQCAANFSTVNAASEAVFDCIGKRLSMLKYTKQ